MIVLDGPHDQWETPAKASAVTIGVYDGVHRGHQEVLRRLVANAGDLAVTVLTFDVHPLALLAPGKAPDLLTTRAQRLELLQAAGVAVVAMLHFDDAVRTMSPVSFVEELLVDRLKARSVVVGIDFRFGYRRGGDIATLTALGDQFGFTVRGLDLLGGDDPLSSTSIRSLIADDGDVAAAALLLGRPFELRGPVVEGDNRGASIGFPTANLAPPVGIVTPRRGVYAVEVVVEGQTHPGVVNVGIRPTFDGTREVVEAHLMDFEGDLYGKEIKVQFLARVRDEQRFDDVAQLVKQIEKDIAMARELISL